MKIDALDRLIEYSLKMQLCLITIGCCLLFSVFYYFFIAPINQQYQQEQFNYAVLFDELNLLTHKINQYPAYVDQISESSQVDDSVNLVLSFSHIVSETLFNHNLQLIDFTRQDDKDFVKVQFKIAGSYPNFIKFMAQLSRLNVNIWVSSIFISQQSESLIFILDIRCYYQ